MPIALVPSALRPFEKVFALKESNARPEAPTRKKTGLLATHGVDTPFTMDDRDPVELAEISRALEDRNRTLIKRMLSQPAGAKVVLWNSGCISLEETHVMIQADSDAVILYSAMHDDQRFRMTGFVYLNNEMTEWKATFVCDPAEDRSP